VIVGVGIDVARFEKPRTRTDRLVDCPFTEGERRV
jgi:hypothetical protein